VKQVLLIEMKISKLLKEKNGSDGSMGKE